MDRARLAGGISSSHAYSATAAPHPLRRVPVHLEGEITLRDIDRSLVERYLAHLHTVVPGVRARITHIGALNTFLQTIRRNGWGDGALSPTAMLFSDDFPKPPELVPRSLPENVMAQVEDPANLDRFKDRTGG